LVTDATAGPTHKLWSLALLGDHKRRQGDPAGALALAERALAHTPTVIELYTLKARALKALGRVGEAADVLVAARGLDLADRHINSKAAKYLARADRPAEAFDTVALFARHDGGEPLAQVTDMQHMWLEVETGAAHARRGEVAMALKRFHDVMRHFDDYVRDQFDFHAYSLRRMTLRTYLEVRRSAASDRAPTRAREHAPPPRLARRFARSGCTSSTRWASSRTRCARRWRWAACTCSCTTTPAWAPTRATTRTT
jgi:peptide alpha-N-acetyltransferase